LAFLVSYLILDICFLCNDPATTGISTLSLHDALPICVPRSPPTWRCCGEQGVVHRDDGRGPGRRARRDLRVRADRRTAGRGSRGDRKSTRLNSSHVKISYAVFCLKKKKHTTVYSGTST